MIYKTRCSWKFHKIHRKITVPESSFNKVKKALAQLFSKFFEFCEIFKNILFTEHLRVTASVNINFNIPYQSYALCILWLSWFAANLHFPVIEYQLALKELFKVHLKKPWVTKTKSVWMSLINADLKISLYVRVHIKIMYWKVHNFNAKDYRVIYPLSLRFS